MGAKTVPLKNGSLKTAVRLDPSMSSLNSASSG